jgi:hypothetical protein
MGLKKNPHGALKSSQKNDPLGGFEKELFKLHGL